MIEPLLMAFIALLFALPGILLSFALLHGQAFSRFEKLLLGVILGVLVPPGLAILEFLTLGLLYNTPLVLANLALIVIVAVALMFKNNQLRQIPAGFKDVLAHWTNVKHDWPMKALFVALIALMIFGFVLRFQFAWSTSFFEFDPYYYDQLTRMLVQTGQVPATSDLSYFPQIRNHREFPVIHYLTGAWYMLHQDFQGALFDKSTLILIIQLYPPLVGMLMAAAAYFYFKEGYGPPIGLMAAALVTVMPQLISKFGAGVSEQAPFGIFTSVLAFAVFGMAIKRDSIQLGIIAAIVSFLLILGSAHHIWPFIVISAYIVLQSMADFLRKEETKHATAIYGLFALGGFLGNVFLTIYRVTPITFETFGDGTLLLVMGALFAAFLHAISHYKLSQRFNLSHKQVLGIVLAVGFLGMIVSPVGAKLVGTVNANLGYATVGNALYKTVQEGAATNSGYYKSAFGDLNPETLLLVATLITVLYAFIVLWRKSEKQYAISFAAASIAIVVFNAQVDSVLSLIANGVLGFAPAVSTLLRFLISSDVFIYMFVSLVSTILAYAYAEKHDRLALLTVLIIFPVSYIGLSRVKYLVHLAVAVAFMVPFIVGELKRIVEYLNDHYKFAEGHHLAIAHTVLIVLVGLLIFNAEIPYANGASQGLQYSRISSDWQLSLDWMKNTLKPTDRMISWWDYGHWTVFFGETKTVLDPGNNYPEYDQETAYGFVVGPASKLVDIMKFHGATYALLDSELVPKWGALNYLASTYNGSFNNFKPDNTDWNAGPGQSQFEFEHSFEQIYSTYQANPAGGSPTPAQCPGVIPRPLMYSGFGAFYCLDASTGTLTLLVKPGEEKTLKAPQLVNMGGDSNPNVVPLGSTGLYYNANAVFMNLNPDLGTISGGKLTGRLFDAPFVQLFFFEKLPGFELAYKSPNGQVKIFKLIDNSPSSSLQDVLPSPTPSPTATPEPTATPAPTPEPTPLPVNTSGEGQNATVSATPSPVPANGSNASS